MEVSSRRKLTASGYRYARDSEYEFDFNDISRASTPTSTFSSKSEGRKRDREHRYSIDDYKRKIARLKSELDMEKAKNKKVHKEKSAELRELRETFEETKESEIKEIQRKLKHHQEKEIRKIQENLTENKDRELQEVLKYKEEEVKRLKSQYREEKESAVKLALENEKRTVEEREKKVQEEMDKLKQDKENLEAEYRKKCEEESRKEKDFAKIKAEYDAELRRILGESKKLALGNLEKLKKAEKALSENVGDSDDEITSIDFSELVADLHSQASSRAVSRSVSTTSELKLDELNINAFLASVTPSPASMLGGPTLDQALINKESKSRSNSVASEPIRDIFNRKLEDKDRQLQKKLSELQAQTQRLERKIAVLKTENESLKRKQDDKKPLEEKIKTLKKRNAELAAIARRLEEKAKHLQQENARKSREMTGQTDTQGTEQMKKMFARQRAKDLAEHAKNMLAKDREIEELRKKCQELADQLSNADFSGPENSQMYSEKEELETIIKLAAKERLQLERQLAKVKPTPGSKIVDAEKYKELEETNEVLKKELTKLEKAINDTERLEIELTQKKLECERLTRDIEEAKTKTKLLEDQLQESETKNTELSTEVSSLQGRLQEFDKVNEECSTLRLNLSDAQQECEIAKNEVSVLQAKVQNLETVVKNLEFSTEQLKQVEKDYHDSVQKLQEKQQEIDQLQKVQESARERYEQAIKSLQEKIHGLEDQCHQQQQKQQELTDELTILCSQAVKSSSKETTNIQIQTGQSIEFAPSANRTSSPNISPSHSPANKPTSSIKSPNHVNESAAVQLKVNHNETSQTSSRKIIPASEKHEHNTESTKSLDTGFAEDEAEDTNHSPEHTKTSFDDPELNEISKKLKELEAESSDSYEGDSKADKGEDSGMESRGDHRLEKDSEMSLVDSRLSALTEKGPIQVYMSKYSYDPYQYSPNENPEAELPLQAGDYVLVYGDMDEDGFFEGELIDGRRGLVPSNFIEKVADEDLPEFHAAMAGHHDDDSTTANSIQQDLEFDSSEEADKQEGESQGQGQESKVKVEPSSDLDDIEEEEDSELLSKSKDSSVKEDSFTGAPYPKDLQLDRQLSNSIMVSWSPPDNLSHADIRSYHVFVDSDFKTAVRGSERTKALLENVESQKVHRVSVRCISSKGQSLDNHCTILVGKDAVPAPSELRVSDITTNSATVSWLPGNSNYHHSVCVDGQEVRVVKPGVFSYQLTGLSKATSHKVSVQAKKLISKSRDPAVSPDQLTSATEFKTATGGLPDPPVNVQVEAGPQEGSLLLTWLPVTIDTSGLSNGALVIGYLVYADGIRVKEVYGATNDHTVLGSSDFQRFVPKKLIVRTLAAEKVESLDSEVVDLPHSLVKEITAGAVKAGVADAGRRSGIRKSPVSHGPLETDINIDAPFQDPFMSSQNAHINNPFMDSYIDSSCSELSDIPEVEEETSSPEPANENSPYKEAGLPLVNGMTNESSDFYLSPIQEAKHDGKKTRHDGKPPRPGPKTSSPQHMSASQEGKQSPVRMGLNRDSPVRKKLQMSGSSGSPMQSPRTVPAIEITQESTDLTGSFDSTSLVKEVIGTEVDNEMPRQDSMEKVSQSKHSPVTEHSNQSTKYSASKDQRDGYREHSGGRIKSPRHTVDGAEHSRGSSSPGTNTHRAGQRGVSSRDNPSPRDISPRDHSSGIRPSSRENERGGSQNSLVSPRSEASSLEFVNRSSPGKDRTSPHSQRGYSGTKGNLGRRNQDTNANELSSKDVYNKARGETPDLDTMDKDSISGEINPPLDDNRIRLFVALFDYDPETMSPNVDALDEELPFREGQIIEVYGDKDADGFYRGKCGCRMGFIPCNMVSEIQVDDPELEEQLMKESQENGTMATSAVTAQLSASEKYMKPIKANGVHLSPNSIPSVHTDLPVRRMVAMYDYDPQELSPNVDAEVELSFRTGDIIMTYGEMDDDGFYMGELNGHRGLVPSNFLQEAPLSDDEALESVSVVSPARSGESINTTESRKSDRGDKPSPKLDGTAIGLASTQLDPVESSFNQINYMNSPRSLSPEEPDLKQKQKKSGGILTKGKNILKKLTR